MMQRFFLILSIIITSVNLFGGWEDLPPPANNRVDRPEEKSEVIPVDVELTEEVNVESKGAEPTPIKEEVKAPKQRSRAVSKQGSNGETRKEAPKEDTEDFFFDIYAPHLDFYINPKSEYRVIYYTPFEKNGKSITSADISTKFNLYDYHDFLGADFRLSLSPELKLFTDDMDLPILPDLFVAVPLNFDLTWRFVNNWSWKIGAAPGIYSDVEFGGDMLYVPFHVATYYAPREDVSIKLGVEVRPGWDMSAMPLAGIAWQPNDNFCLELGVPRTMATWRIGIFSLFGKVQWDNKSFSATVEEDKKAKLVNGKGEKLTISEPELITFDSWRVGAGLSINFTPRSCLALEAGSLIKNEIIFEGSDGEHSFEYEPKYFGITLSTDF